MLSAAYCNHLPYNTKTGYCYHLVMLSVFMCTEVVTLSGFHRNLKEGKMLQHTIQNIKI
jgi:hypothetical protein